MADMILLGLAIICTAYFMVIVFYAGMGNLLCFIWLFFAALCVFLVYGKWYYRKNYGPHPTVGAGEHCYYLYCRCGHYGSPLYHGVYGERQPVKKGTLTM